MTNNPGKIKLFQCSNEIDKKKKKKKEKEKEKEKKRSVTILKQASFYFAVLIR